MLQQLTSSSKGFAAQNARVGFVFTVRPQMTAQVASVAESFSAEGALVRLFAGVNSEMRFHVRLVSEFASAKRANYSLVCMPMPYAVLASSSAGNV